MIMIISETSKVKKNIVPVVHYTSRKMKFNVYFYILKVRFILVYNVYVMKIKQIREEKCTCLYVDKTRCLR